MNVARFKFLGTLTIDIKDFHIKVANSLVNEGRKNIYTWNLFEKEEIVSQGESEDFLAAVYQAIMEACQYEENNEVFETLVSDEEAYKAFAGKLDFKKHRLLQNPIKIVIDDYHIYIEEKFDEFSWVVTNIAETELFMSGQDNTAFVAIYKSLKTVIEIETGILHHFQDESKISNEETDHMSEDFGANISSNFYGITPEHLAKTDIYLNPEDEIYDLPEDFPGIKKKK